MKWTKTKASDSLSSTLLDQLATRADFPDPVREINQQVVNIVWHSQQMMMKQWVTWFSHDHQRLIGLFGHEFINLVEVFLATNIHSASGISKSFVCFTFSFQMSQLSPRREVLIQAPFKVLESTSRHEDPTWLPQYMWRHLVDTLGNMNFRKYSKLWGMDETAQEISPTFLIMSHTRTVLLYFLMLRSLQDSTLFRSSLCFSACHSLSELIIWGVK